MVGNAHIQKLMGSQAQEDSNGGIDLIDGPGQIASQNPVETSLGSQASIDKFGGKCRVARVQALM